MSKVTREDFIQDPRSESEAESETEGESESAATAGHHDSVDSDAGESDGGVDLKATVTLSGEALAALLEEVKKARSTTEPAATKLPEVTWPILAPSDDDEQQG